MSIFNLGSTTYTKYIYLASLTIWNHAMLYVFTIGVFFDLVKLLKCSRMSKQPI